MSNVFKKAAKSMGEYAGTQERGRGIEFQRSGAEALSQYDIGTMMSKTNQLAQVWEAGEKLSGWLGDVKETREAAKGMKAKRQKRTLGEFLVGAESKYEFTDKSGKSISRTASELKTDWKAKGAKAAEEYDPSKAKSPTMLEEATQPKESKGFIGKHKGLDVLGGKGFIGEEKGIDTKTKDWFQSLFKGGSDKDTTVDSNAQKPVTDAKLIPDPDSKSSVATPKQSDLDRVNMYKQKNSAPDDTINMSLWNQEKEATNLGELSLSRGRNWSNILGN